MTNNGHNTMDQLDDLCVYFNPINFPKCKMLIKYILLKVIFSRDVKFVRNF